MQKTPCFLESFTLKDPRGALLREQMRAQETCGT